MMTERVKKLREQSLNAIPRISMERAEIVDKVYKKYEGAVPTPVLRALVLKEIMSNKKLCINDGELIVGERGEAPAATPTYPELCCHTIEDFEIMDKREKISFKVNEEAKKIQKEEIIPYWEKRSMRYHILENMTDEWKECYAAGIFTEFMEQRGPGHTVADGKIYKKGFLDFKKDIEKAIEELDFLNDHEALDKKNQLEAMSIACDAIMILGKRYAEYAKELAEKEENPERKKELLEISEVCSWVPAHAPRTFREALQMYWFVHLCVITELNPWDSFNPGRLDQHLYPYYKKETEAGTLTEEQAKEYLQCFWVKFNNQPAPPKVGVTLKESGTYTDFANINSGGVKSDGSDGVNDVSYIVLDVIDEMKLLQPSSNVQISKKTPQKFLKRALKIVRKGWGQPSLFNTDAVVQEMLRAGKTVEDARDGGTSGCVETGAFGKEAYILTGYFNLPKILEITLNNGVDPETGKKLGIETGDPTEFKTYEELFEAYKKQLKHFIDIKVRGNRVIERLYATKMPVPFLSVIIDDCISKGKDYNAGGARYNTSYIQGVGIGNITDALTSIKYNVFDNKKLTMEELLNAVKKNFEGHEDILHLVKNKTPKYGNDDDYADEIMTEVFHAYYNEVTGRPNGKGGVHRINMLPTTCHVYFGSVIGATPDGRLANTPLADGISPSKGADKNGPTGVIKSASKMDHIITGGTLLNQKFTPSVVQGEEGLDNLAHLVRSYFKMDGHHIQFNIISKETLIEAQNKPEEYKNLIVRVAGYSDYFGNLDKVLQDEIIERTEQNF
ncbi:MAG: glycyl radical protein [Clostridiaceae bacterium]|uniref:trans-4-hydroxy-L-proline dehydratase n=1 Tax=Clostridium sp. cpc1 TaxID=2016536 RepID=UPI002240A48F|nr:trans-4-hydroxy-L-proline dehydratase [Clostridium sp. cpc1]MBW4827725.1 glycyl radical protein [Clostridiaceae bacterium]MBW4860654.1 glycyl radical protein [Clostridiaceae bacterium]MBW4868950.1 glycyl radical protein [Clostridiaceae bacterium]MCW7999633.1 formate C-acetyltransferase/glycerol dehydratase family glycyl radical enzyme [Clostridium sp. cpc1]